MNLEEKITILAESAKYDVSCSSSGVEGAQRAGSVGSTAKAGICHSFTSDGRCVSLLKLLLTNSCIFDCHYCINRRSNQIPRATFTPEEIARLTMDFYLRNYIEGLFLSSAIIKNPDYTCELLIKTLRLLRETHGFRGYIHVKAIPGADEKLIQELGFLADRMSVNVELPSRASLEQLAPDKNPLALYKPMKQISQIRSEQALIPYRQQAKFVPAGQSTQMIIGASPETDYEIVRISEKLYQNYQLKRVYYSAYIPVNDDSLLPAIETDPPLLREHRLYQADWLMRYYQFQAEEILTKEKPNFNLYLDPKANWAVQHYETFPVDIQTASYHWLLRVPGIGPKGAKKIMQARKYNKLDWEDLKKLGIVLKRAKYFIRCSGETQFGVVHDPTHLIASLMSAKQYQTLKKLNTQSTTEQLSLFDVDQVDYLIANQ